MRLRAHQPYRCDEGFNSRTHAGCDYRISRLRLKLKPFQFTHPRGVRLMLVFSVPNFLVVSIHAPTRGATFSWWHTYVIINVSIHAPTRGATYLGVAPSCHHQVSIHAPTRGATNKNLKVKHNYLGFNSRTHAGCDSCRPSTRIYAYVSIHAPTRGATQSRLWRLQGFSVSIHAPTRGATFTSQFDIVR